MGLKDLALVSFISSEKKKKDTYANIMQDTQNTMTNGVFAQANLFKATFGCFCYASSA